MDITYKEEKENKGDCEWRMKKIRVTHRKARGRRSARYLFRCGCCDERLEVYYSDTDNLVEINGVVGTKEEWRRLLEPVLK